LAARRRRCFEVAAAVGFYAFASGVLGFFTLFEESHFELGSYCCLSFALHFTSILHRLDAPLSSVQLGSKLGSSWTSRSVWLGFWFSVFWGESAGRKFP